MTNLSDPASIEHATVFALRGELDITTADAIRGAARLTAASGGPALVLDLAGVDFMDSQGLKALLDAHGLLEQAGSRLVLHRSPRCVQRLLDMTGLDGLFHRA